MIWAYIYIVLNVNFISDRKMISNIHNSCHYHNLLWVFHFSLQFHHGIVFVAWHSVVPILSARLYLWLTSYVIICWIVTMISSGSNTTMLWCLLCTKPSLLPGSQWCSWGARHFIWTISSRWHISPWFPSWLSCLFWSVCQKYYSVCRHIFCFYSGWGGCWCW